MLVALNDIAKEQKNPTNTTMKKVKNLNYVSSHHEAIVTDHASDLILKCHSDASYISKLKARIRSGGHFLLSENNKTPKKNGAVLNIDQIIKVVIMSGAEAQIEAMYINACESIIDRISLIVMRNPQPRLPMQMDNSAVHSVVTNNIHTIITNAMDMQLQWLRCQYDQGHLRYYWRPGKHNLAKYWKKYDLASHHRENRYKVFTPTCQLEL